MSQAELDNYANQLNPNNPNYQGGRSNYGGSGTKADLDNHSRQLNPQDAAKYSGGQGQDDDDDNFCDDDDD